MYLYEVNQGTKYNIHLAMYVIDSSTTSRISNLVFATSLHIGTYITKQGLVAQCKSIIFIPLNYVHRLAHLMCDVINIMGCIPCSAICMHVCMYGVHAYIAI